MRKLVLMLMLLICTATAMDAQVGSPYKYGHRWNIALYGGELLFDGDYSEAYLDHYMAGFLFCSAAGLTLGYNITDGYELRFSANYGKKTGVAPPVYGFLPYSFQTVNLFGDYMVSFEALGEYYTAFNPKLYVGLGATYSFGFLQSWEEGEGPELSVRNLVPAFRFGTVLEYDFRSGLGLFADFGIPFFLDPYNGLGYSSFPLDFEIDAFLGIIYHFK